MSAVELTGRPLAAEIRARVAEEARQLAEAGAPVCLVVVTATEDEASAWYVRSIAKAADAAGIVCDVRDLGPDASGAAIDRMLRQLSADPGVSAIILQTPLPAGVALDEMASAIAVEKDIDGVNPLSIGRLVAAAPAFPPATAAAVMALLDHYGVELAGRHAVVVGRSTVVGKPAAHLLLDRDATVTVCHSRTRDLAQLTRQADVLVAAAGRPGLLTPDHVRRGAVVVDVATNATEDGGLVGDVLPAVADVAQSLSPVPGGVGPVTTALLLEHAVLAARRAHDVRQPG